jgi:hypothetical protein
MKNRVLASVLGVLAVAFAAVLVTRDVQALPPGPTMLNVKTDCGAVGDGLVDDGPAFNACMNAGGTTFVPRGRYRIATAVVVASGDQAQGMICDGSATEIFADGDPTSFVAFTFQSQTNAWVEKCTFVGKAPTSAGVYDARHLFVANPSQVGTVIFRDVEFHGVAVYGSIIRAQAGLVDRCLFAGVTAGMYNSEDGLGGAAVDFFNASGDAIVRESKFLDYSASRGWSKTPEGVRAWIRYKSSGDNDGEASSTGTLYVLGNRADEGATFVDARQMDGWGQPVAQRVSHIYMADNRYLEPAGGDVAFLYAWGVDHIHAERNRVHVRDERPIFNLRYVRSVKISQMTFELGASLGGGPPYSGIPLYLGGDIAETVIDDSDPMTVVSNIYAPPSLAGKVWKSSRTAY